MSWFGKKKKEEIPSQNSNDSDLGYQDQYMPQQNFQRPFFEPISNPSNTEFQLILSKLELLNTKIQQIEQRLIQLERIERKIDNIEKIAVESQEPPKRW